MFADAHVFDKEYQGTRTFIKELYSALAQEKNLHIYLGAYDIDRLKTIFPDHDNITFLRYKSKSPFRRLLYDIPLFISQYKIDYAHFQYIIPVAKNCRYIVTIHDVVFDEAPEEFSLSYRLSKKMFYKRAALKADLVTTVSEYSKHSICRHLAATEKNVHIIPNGVNEKFFLPYNKTLSQKIIAEKYGLKKFILYVGRFEPRKNHVGLLKAYLELKLYEKGVQLALLGHKTLKVPEFDDLLSSLPDHIKSGIFIDGNINDELLLDFYRAASVFVYPSKAEGFGIPPLEAAALKIPVICSNASAMSEFSFFGENHIDPVNTALLKERLMHITTDLPSAKELQNISDIIQTKYSWNQSAEKFYQLILKDYTTSFFSKLNTNDQLLIP